MAEEQEMKDGAPAAVPEPTLHVAPGPHVSDTSLTTRRMMMDVLIALIPVVLISVWIFRGAALLQMAICVVSCMVAEAGFTAMRGRKATLGDCSAAVTGLILGLSLPGTAPWFVGVVASAAAIGFGKVVFGGVGSNIFNPAMVGRAFVMIAFPAMLGASAYVVPGAADGISGATPLTMLKQGEGVTPLLSLLLGTTNGSLGETSALACLLGGLYLCVRRTASWEIPLGIIATVLVIAGVGQLGGAGAEWGALHHVCSGALLFGAFFIATDPVSSPLTPRGKLIFGIGIGAVVMLLRALSGYPEGVMFAVLLMNAVTPLINRWTIPRPVGGPVPKRG